MELQIGVASGEVVEVDGDCYGDAVNLASRLSDLAGPSQIWATESVIEQLRGGEVRHRNLGPINIRGKNEMPIVHRIDWQDEVSEFLTMPASLVPPARGADSSFGQIELAWLDVRSMFRAAELPIHLGRVDEAQFVVNDPRVSRLHARIEARQGSCVLVDVSTYGTWVRFHGTAGASGEIALRRDECVLHGSGEIGLGAPLERLQRADHLLQHDRRQRAAGSSRTAIGPLRPQAARRARIFLALPAGASTMAAYLSAAPCCRPSIPGSRASSPPTWRWPRTRARRRSPADGRSAWPTS